MAQVSLAVGLGAWLLGIKETNWILLPLVVVAVLGWTPRAWGVILGAWGLGWAITSLVAWDGLALVKLAPILLGQVHNQYHLAYQLGPPHRVLLDLLTLAPLATVLGVMGAGISRRKEIVCPVLVTVGFFALLPTHNLRYSLPLDPLARVLGASWCFEVLPRWWAWAVIGASAGAEFWIFWHVFEVGQVYDPVAANLLRALGVIP